MCNRTGTAVGLVKQKKRGETYRSDETSSRKLFYWSVKFETNLTVWSEKGRVDKFIFIKMIYNLIIYTHKPNQLFAL